MPDLYEISDRLVKGGYTVNDYTAALVASMSEYDKSTVVAWLNVASLTGDYARYVTRREVTQAIINASTKINAADLLSTMNADQLIRFLQTEDLL